MTKIGAFLLALWSAIWTCGLAVALTAISSGIWSGLFLANIRTTPALPWSVIAMAVFLLATWTFLNGNWGGGNRQARRPLLRARAVSRRLFVWALIAGGLSLAALAGLWIVLFQLMKMPGNTSDFSTLPPLTYLSALVMASLSGALTEEAGFRGYFQGTLERYLSAPLAVLLSAAAMIPEHGFTQGFVLPTILFYLATDAMLGTIACLTQSILPGIIIHAAGLVAFFGVVWPQDKARVSIWIHGPDQWFWIHLVQAVLFGVLALAAFNRLVSARQADFDRAERKP